MCQVRRLWAQSRCRCGSMCEGGQSGVGRADGRAGTAALVCRTCRSFRRRGTTASSCAALRACAFPTD
jgi:hypothetical protein